MATEISKIITYPVWVGSLAEVADKNVLMAHFRKFGPLHSVKVMKDETGKSKLFGYINYHNQEVAEVAAREMNGIEICGRKIKTKGPTELKPYSPVVLNEKVDIRGLMDCNYYLQGDCKRKDGQACPYRHFIKGLGSTTLCEKWTRRLCDRKDCPNLHPGSKPDNADKPELSAEDVTLNRCNSHNSYKCYGQCGKSMCNTHFDNERCLIDHVMISTEQKSIPRCTQCNAVFFNEEEKAKHRHTPDSKPVQRTDSIGLSHSKSEPIGVFWDIENCQIPKGKSPIAVVNKIRERFYPGRREVEFMCVCDTTKEKKEVLEDLNKAQINILHINALSKNAADDKLKQALRRFALVHKPPATIVVISGDINFATELSDLRHRLEFRVILLHNKQASNALLQCANESVCFEIFIADIPSFIDEPQVDTTSEVVITNLPTATSIPKIKGRLNTLTCNTGGKVISISPNESMTENIAIIKFPDSESAQRATQRLQKENIFGNEIHVVFKKKKSEPPPNLMDVKINNINIGERSRSDINPPNTVSQPSKHKDFNANTVQPTAPSERRKQKTKNHNSVVLDEKPANQTNKKATSHTGGKDTSHPSGNIFSNTSIPPPQKMSNNHKNYTKQNILPPNNIYHTTTVRAWEPMVTNLIQDTIHNSINNGIDLLVSNLDQSIKVKEVRRTLTCMFREHSKVTSVDLVGHGKENAHAFIKVPKLLDAQTCISKLNNQMLFSKRIKVELASARQDALLKMKSDVTNILLDTFCGWLPLNEFMAAYKLRHQKAFHIVHLDHMRDLVYIDGQPGFQFVCLLHFPVGLIKVKHDATFEEEIIDILKYHNRRVPFASIPGLYWSYLNKLIPLDENGEMMVRIAQNKKVSLVGNTPAQQAIFYKKCIEKGELFPLDDFKRDVIEFLQVSPSFCIHYRRFSSLYHQFFGRQFSNSDYGFKNLADLLEALADIIQVMEQNGVNIITFSNDFKQKLLNDNIFQMLNFREKHKIPVSSLLTAFYIFYGHKLYFRNFGFTTFQQLAASLDERFKIQGTGESKVVMLTQQRKKCRLLESFAQEVVALIKAQPEKKLALHNLSAEYSKYYGHQLKLAELGFSKLNDLIDALSDYVEIHGNRDEKIIYICQEPSSYNHLWCDVKKILLESPMRSILLLQLPDIYKSKMMKAFPLGQGSMNQFLKSIPEDILKIGKGSNTILIDKTLDICPSVILVQHLKQILYKSEHFKASSETLLKKLLLKKICIDITRINEEVVAHPQIFQITKDKSLQLTYNASRNILQHEIALLLDEQVDKQAHFNHLGNMLSKRLQMVFRVSDYGVIKLQMLIDSLTSGIFEVLHMGQQHIIRLGPLGNIYIGCISLLNEFHGSLLLCNFAPEYSKKYNVQLKPHDYGFVKIGDMLEHFSSLLSIYGEKNTKVIVLNESILNPVIPVEKKIEPEYIYDRAESDRSSDVVIESEEYMEDMAVRHDAVNKDMQLNDLLHFTEDNPGKHEKVNLEWWMEPVPDLPQPALQPEAKYKEVVGDNDLICFTEYGSENLIDSPLDAPSIPLPSLSNPFSFYPQNMERHHDEYINGIFSENFTNIPSSSEQPDLMRLLVGRVSPADGFALPCALDSKSSGDANMSNVSDTYSCFSALENIERQHASRGSYSASLHDIFSDVTQDVRNEPIRPKIAANFQKP